jgi:ParB family chromosome partitioning protein
MEPKNPIPTSEPQEEEEHRPPGEYVMIKTGEILVPETRMTSYWTAEEKDALVESIRKEGILQPLTLISIEGTMYVVDGFNRLMAARHLGLKEIPCIIQERADDDLFVHNVIINQMRGKSLPSELGNVMRHLVEELGIPVQEAADRIQLSPSQARKYLRLTQLPAEIQRYVDSKQLSLEKAYKISQLREVDDQLELASLAVTLGYDDYQIDQAVKHLLNPTRPLDEGDIDFSDLQNPVRILETCTLCGEEIEPADQASLRFHARCRTELKQILEANRIREKEEALMQDQQPPAPPPEQPQQPPQYPPIVEARTVESPREEAEPEDQTPVDSGPGIE